MIVAKQGMTIFSGSKALPLALFIVFCWAVFAAAAAGINADSIWVDEFLSLQYAGWGQDDFQFSEIFLRIVSLDDHRAITYDLLLAGWAKLTGWSVFGARLLSLHAGLLAIAFAWRCGADMHSSAAGRLSALFLGASAFVIVYMHEVRVYALMALLTLVMIWLYWRITRRRGGLGTQLAFAAVVTATLYAHPFAVALVGALGLYHLLFARGESAYARLLLLFAISGALFAPLLVGTLEVIGYFSGADRPPRTLRSNMELLRQLADGLSNGFWLFLLLPLISLRHLRRNRSLELLWFVAAAFLTVMLVGNGGSGMVHHLRYLIPLAPIVALISGIGCAGLPRFRKAIALIVFAWVALGFAAAPAFRYRFYHVVEQDIFHLTFPFNQLAADIRRDGFEGDAVVYEFPHHSFALQGVFDYYMDGAGMPYVLADTLRAGRNWAATIERFERFIADADRVYFALDRTIEATDLAPEYQRILGERFVHCQRLWDRAVASVDKYARDQIACSASANQK